MFRIFFTKLEIMLIVIIEEMFRYLSTHCYARRIRSILSNKTRMNFVRVMKTVDYNIHM
jgi:hypothetical protein